MSVADVTALPLFDTVELFAGSGPRTRKKDRVQSHMAADRSQRTMHATKRAVLALVLQEGELPGSEINDLYALRSARTGWGKVAYDTPRKRAGELAADGFLSARFVKSDGNHLDEAWYSLTDKGRAVLS